MLDDDESSQNLLLDNNDEDVYSEKHSYDAVSTCPTSSSTVKRIKKNEESDDTIKEEDNMLEKFPFHGMNVMVGEEFKPHGEDPRGYDHPYGSRLPSGYCLYCKCKNTLCHDKRFGLYCGLRVAEQIEQKGANTMYGDKVKELMKVAYNEILRVEIVQQVGVLDTHNNYIPPQCMEDRSLKNVMNHFFYMKFTTTMNKRLQDGSKGKYGSGSFGFYTALKEQKTHEK